MDNRKNCGISVIVYHPIHVKSNEEGWIRASYSVAILVAASGTYLVDAFGVGAGPLENPKVTYNQPVYYVSDENSIIDFRAPLIGNIPIGLKTIQTLKIDCSMDLAQFIKSGPDCNKRLEAWAHFWEEDRARSQEI